jgi:hypothetical protein
MEKKRVIVRRLVTREEILKQPPPTLAEMLRQLKLTVPLTPSGQARLEKAEREEAEAKRKNSSTVSKKPRR